MNIFDKDKRKWYEVERGLFGRLHLTLMIYQNVTRFPIGEELEFSDEKGLIIAEPLIPPPTPNPIKVKKMMQE